MSEQTLHKIELQRNDTPSRTTGGKYTLYNFLQVSIYKYVREDVSRLCGLAS